MQFAKTPEWFGKPFTKAEEELLRNIAETMNKGLVGSRDTKAA
jgi:hypothetical protein